MGKTFLPASACPECGKELPYGVHRAYEFLYGRHKHDASTVVDSIQDDLKRRTKTDARRAEGGVLNPVTDQEIGESAIDAWVFDGFHADDLVTAVQHWGDLGDPDGPECDRIVAAKWCHAQDAVLASGTSEEWARSRCDLEADHEGAHSFERVQVAP